MVIGDQNQYSMTEKIIPRPTPEEEELDRKRDELEALKLQLAQEELNLATLENELNLFEGQYIRTIGVLLAQLDEIEAKIAEQYAQENPNDSEAQAQAEKFRKQANESAAGATETESQIQSKHFNPSDEIKELYRKAAKLMHPDLGIDDEDRARRTKFMAEVNAAYRSGDIDRLRMIINEWENSPEMVIGDGTGNELVRVIRSIAKIKERIESIRSKVNEILTSKIYILKTKSDDARKRGRDMLAEMAAILKEKIEAAKKSMTA